MILDKEKTFDGMIIIVSCLKADTCIALLKMMKHYNILSEKLVP